jgi:hypothetical protein
MAGVADYPASGQEKNKKLPPTRTIKVSCLSHFLLLLLLPRQIRNCRCTRTRASAPNLNPVP